MCWNENKLTKVKTNYTAYGYVCKDNIIYDCAYETKNQSNDETFEDTIISNVCEKILYYIKFFNPQKKTFIAFDGVAPIAKLNQQRSRRHKNTFIKKIEHSQKNKNSNWNTVKITPGTNFMQKLNKKIYSFFDNDILFFPIMYVILMFIFELKCL